MIKTEPFFFKQDGESSFEVFFRLGKIDSNPPASEAVDFDAGHFLVLGTSTVCGSKRSAANYLLRLFRAEIQSAAKLATVSAKQARQQNPKQ